MQKPVVHYIRMSMAESVAATCCYRALAAPNPDGAVFETLWGGAISVDAPQTSSAVREFPTRLICGYDTQAPQTVVDSGGSYYMKVPDGQAHVHDSACYETALRTVRVYTAGPALDAQSLPATDGGNLHYHATQPHTMAGVGLAFLRPHAALQFSS